MYFCSRYYQKVPRCHQGVYQIHTLYLREYGSEPLNSLKRELILKHLSD